MAICNICMSSYNAGGGSGLKGRGRETAALETVIKVQLLREADGVIG